MSATHTHMLWLHASLAIVAAISLASLVGAFWCFAKDRECVLFHWRGGPVHADEFFGLAGLVGCAFSSVALIALFFAEVT